MEEDTGRNASEDAGEESDSERRRRRRRRRRRKSRDNSAEVKQLLRVARWGAGVLALLATWAYGVYVYNTTTLGWGALIFFPAGFVSMLGISYAFAVPFFAVLGMIVAFLYRVNSGPVIALQFSLMAFVGIGILNAVWRIFVFFMTKREVTRNEAGFK